jgi:hypothetical protein
MGRIIILEFLFFKADIFMCVDIQHNESKLVMFKFKSIIATSVSDRFCSSLTVLRRS